MTDDTMPERPYSINRVSMDGRWHVVSATPNCIATPYGGVTISWNSNADPYVRENAERVAAEIVSRMNADLARPAPKGVKVKPLDLSNLLKHAFLSGCVAALETPRHEPFVGPVAWTSYDPTSCEAYNRILSVLTFAPEGVSVAEAARVLRDAGFLVVPAAPTRDQRMAFLEAATRNVDFDGDWGDLAADLPDGLRALATDKEDQTNDRA